MPRRTAPPNYLDFYTKDSLVEQNAFVASEPDRSHPPHFAESQHLLPAPFWDGHESAIQCYWRAWELAFRSLRPATRASGFIAPYIDTAFNECLFMWDSAFILLFARYGSRAFDFQRTLDNLYAKQHRDGFISREVHEWDGDDQFHRHDPASTGPNVLPWCEIEHYRNFADRGRLERVFPPLLAYHRWMRRHRSWPDGAYWSCGLACGMDNQPRVSEGRNPALDHGHMSWIDATAQAALSARILAEVAEEIGRTSEVDDLREERALLERVVNDTMWDADARFYADRRRDGSLSDTRTIGAYWTLLADLVPGPRLEDFVAHLENPQTFDRPHRVPTLAADHPEYQAEGGYWRGGVWPPTNYMLLRGLTHAGCDDLAHDIALNHHRNVVEVFEQTGTLWENYAPESAAPGQPAKPDFVGWSGLGPIAVLFENVFGIRADVPAARIVWDVRLTEAHGIMNYPYGTGGTIDLRAEARGSDAEPPVVEIASDVPVEVEIRWDGGRRRESSVRVTSR